VRILIAPDPLERGLGVDALEAFAAALRDEGHEVRFGEPVGAPQPAADVALYLSDRLDDAGWETIAAYCYDLLRPRRRGERLGEPARIEAHDPAGVRVLEVPAAPAATDDGAQPGV
jgi:hypothetical protein